MAYALKDSLKELENLGKKTPKFLLFLYIKSMSTNGKTIVITNFTK